MEEKIALYMKNLGISRDEAIQLIKDDENDVSVELTAEQKKVASDVTRTTGDKTERKPRTRKPDENKRALVTMLETFLIGICADPVVVNPEREIEFDFMGAHYKLILSKPREKK